MELGQLVGGALELTAGGGRGGLKPRVALMFLCGLDDGIDWTIERSEKKWKLDYTAVPIRRHPSQGEDSLDEVVGFRGAPQRMEDLCACALGF